MREYYNEVLCKILSEKIVVRYNPSNPDQKEKILKKGIFKNWKCNPFFMEWYIKTDKKEETLKLFYPFKCETHEKEFGLESIFLDYRLSSFNKFTKSNFSNKDIEKFSSHKFLNSIISVEVTGVEV